MLHEQQSASGQDAFLLAAENQFQLDKLQWTAALLFRTFNFVRLLQNHHHFVGVEIMGFIYLGVGLGVCNIENHPTSFFHVISRHWPD